MYSTWNRRYKRDRVREGERERERRREIGWTCKEVRAGVGNLGNNVLLSIWRAVQINHERVHRLDYWFSISSTYLPQKNPLYLCNQEVDNYQPLFRTSDLANPFCRGRVCVLDTSGCKLILIRGWFESGHRMESIKLTPFSKRFQIIFLIHWLMSVF